LVPADGKVREVLDPDGQVCTSELIGISQTVIPLRISGRWHSSQLTPPNRVGINLC
jgi:hypothetical protein